MKNLSLYIVYLFVFFHYSVSARTILKNICIDIDSVQISRDWDRRRTYFLRGNDHWRHPRQSHRPTSCLCGRYSNTKKNGRISCDWCSRLLHYRYWFRNFKLNLSNYAMWTMWNYHYVISIYIWNDRALHTRTWTMCRTRTLWYANT